MELTIVACAPGRVVPPDRAGHIVRLVGMPEPGDVLPPGLLETADRAAEMIRTTYPRWLWTWAETSGVLSLATCPGPISWWWYSPISEMSPMRSPLIRDLYRIVLLRRLVAEHAITRVTWLGDDQDLARVAGNVVREAGAGFSSVINQARRRDHLWIHIARRLREFATHATRVVALRIAGFGDLSRRRVDVLFYTRFPILWENRPEGPRERMFGDWPRVLARRGVRVAYGAVFTGSLRDLVFRGRQLRARCAEHGIVLVEAFTSLRRVASAHLDPWFVVRYLRWRRQHRASPVRFDGADVSTLFWRDMNANALSPEVAYDRVLADTLGRSLDQPGEVRAVCLPFEYQPMERAVTIAARQRGIPVVGVQTGLFTSNQMGFTFPAEQVRVRAQDAARAPLPDVLAAYGDLPYRAFAERLGETRVCLSGPIRYANLADPPKTNREAFLRDHALAPGTTVVLVATPATRAEAVLMLDSAFRAAASRSHVVVVVKFHYHRPLHEETARLARRHGVSEYRVLDVPLEELLAGASVMICGASSTGIEAIARGCVPLVYRSVGEFSANPMLDVPDAAFFWQTPEELAQVMGSALSEDEACARRRAHWPAALRAQLSPLDHEIEGRLDQHLWNRGFLLDHGRPPAIAAETTASFPETAGR